MTSISKKLKELKDYRSISDPKIKSEIIVNYSLLIKYIAQKILARLPSNIELDDLISCGVIGLMDAIEKFDPSHNNKFKTYAEFRIRGAILDELRAQDWVPRSIREKAKLIERNYTRLESELGRPATDDEMCQALNCTLEEFYQILNQSKPVFLLNVDDNSSFSRCDKKLIAGIVEDSYSTNPLNAVSYKNIRESVKEGIKSLPEKQRLVLSLYYYEDLNLKEIGKILDVTESRISQLHTQAIIKLRSKLKSIFKHPDDIAS